MPVAIDIKPGDDTNSINLRSKTVSVVILSAAGFYAPIAVERASLTFGATGDEAKVISCDSKPKDVNGDGYKDLICSFSTRAAFPCDSGMGILKGQTMDTQLAFEGSQEVEIIQTIPLCPQ